MSFLLFFHTPVLKKNIANKNIIKTDKEKNIFKKDVKCDSFIFFESFIIIIYKDRRLSFAIIILIFLSRF